MFENQQFDEDTAVDWDAIVAHQLKTPLCALDAALSQSETVDPTSVRRDILRLTQLIDQLQRFAKHRNGAAARRRSVDLGLLVRSVVADLVPLASARGHEIIFRDLSGGCDIQADPVLAGEAIRNVVENAMKYGGKAGPINVVVTSNGRVGIMDRGPGIPPSEHKAVFKRGQRATTKKSGFGLGLFLVSEIMRREEGRVSLRPRRGGGTAVILWFRRTRRSKHA